MIDNVNDMEWKNKDTLRSMVEKYNTNLHDLVNEANHKATCTDNNTVVSSNNSYARVCEWSDRNQHGEDRTGYFVSTTSEGVVEVANSKSKVLGVSVQSPAFSSDVKDENIDYTKNLLSDYCYVALMGSVQVRQDGTLKVGQRCVSNAVGIATFSENVGCIVTKIIDDNTAVISLEPSTDSIKQAYEFLFNKIENKKAGLVEVNYATWTNMSDKEKVALGDVIVPDHPVDYSLEDIKQNVDKLSTDVTEIKSTIENGDFGSSGNDPCTCAKYLKVTEDTHFVYDSAITTELVDGVLKNVFNADENLSVYKDNDKTKFSLGTIIYTSVVEVDLGVEDDNAWKWHYVLPISAEHSTVDLTTVEWLLSDYQPNHEDDEEKPTESTISTVGFITFLLKNSSDASDTATFDIYDLSNVTTKTARVSLSNSSENSTLELLPTSIQYNGQNLVRSVNGVGASENGNIELVFPNGIYINGCLLTVE